MASWKFSVTCPLCGARVSILQELKDTADTYLAACDIDQGGCGKSFAFEARQSVVVGQKFTLLQAPGVKP